MASIFQVRATGGAGTYRPDAREVYRALAVLADPEHGVQLQAAPHWAFRTFPGNDLDAQVAWIEQQQGATACYYALNPVAPNLPHRVRSCDVLRRRWLLVDVDRNKGTQGKLSATDAEHEACRRMAFRVNEYLGSFDWPAPVMIDSGNGWHLLYRVDLPNDAGSQALLKKVLAALAERFDGPDGSIGAECHDARRISKLPGTWARNRPAAPDRPHRMARLTYDPSEVWSMSADLLKRVLDDAAKPADQSTTDTLVDRSAWQVSAGNGRGKAYARAALDREVARVRLTDAGNRNNVLNDAAFRLGQLVAEDLLERGEVESALYAAAVANGLLDDDGERTTLGTIRSGLDAGRDKPRDKPPPGGKTEKEQQQKQQADDLPEGEPVTICAAAVTPLSVDWLWPDRVPKRFVTIFAGRTCLGKSFVACDLTARLSVGGLVPLGNGQTFRPGGTLFISEDSPDYVTVPRLIEAQADLSRVRFLSWKALLHYSLDNVALLQRACDEVGECRLVVIDPPTNFLKKVDEHRNAEIRQALLPLVGWCQEHDAACVLITHVNKQTGKGVEALNRVLGSVAWVTTSRVAHSFAPNPDARGEYLFVPMKNNLGPVPKGLSYRLVSGTTSARVDWLAEVDTTADDAMSGEPARPRRVVASQWLIDLFRQKRTWDSDELFRAAKAAGISRSAVFEAKDLLDLPKARRIASEGGNVTYEWWVPADWPPIQPEKGSEEF